MGNSFIKVTELSEISNEIKQVISTLDGGEKQVISLGSVTSGQLILLLDDKARRNAAKKLGLATTGLVGVLIFPKEKGLINDVILIPYPFSDLSSSKVRPAVVVNIYSSLNDL